MSKRTAPTTSKRSGPKRIDLEFDRDALIKWLNTLDAETRDFLIDSGFINPDGTIRTALQLQSIRDLFDAGYGITPSTLAQVRSMNAGARGELREKAQWINDRINEGYTREQARHLYYEWAGEGDDPQSFNPDRTLSDEEVDELYQDWSSGNTPRALQKRITTGGQVVTRKDGTQFIIYEGETYNRRD